MSFLRALWLRLLRDDCAGMAAEIAYNWMLALIPILIFLFSLFGMVTQQPDLFNQVLDSLHRIVPNEAFLLVRATLTELTRSSNGGLAVVSFLGALWTGSNGAVVIEKALNRAYRRSRHRRNFWRQRLVALLGVLGVGIILILSTNLVVFGTTLLHAVAQWWRPEGWVLTFLSILRWLMPIGGLLAVSLFIYTVVPERKEQRTWKTIWPGAFTFSILWILISLLFGAYVSHLSTYNKIYGPMGAIIVLMVWLYLTSYALLIGGEVNALRWQHTFRSQKPQQKPTQYRRFSS